MDLHLDYIVDQTTKYSKWLVKGLGSTTSSAEPSLQSTASSSLNGQRKRGICIIIRIYLEYLRGGCFQQSLSFMTSKVINLKVVSQT